MATERSESTAATPRTLISQLQQWEDFYTKASHLICNASNGGNQGKDHSKKTTKTNVAKKLRGKRRRQKNNAAPMDPQAVLSQFQSILFSLRKLLSSLDQSTKEHACKNGAISIIVKMANFVLQQDASLPNSNQQKFLSLVCKSLQTCVFQNPAGRAVCRREGVFRLLHRIAVSVSAKTPAEASTMALELLEDAFTSLAAICLGDDLNAVLAALQLGEVVQDHLNQKVANDNSNSSSLDQTLRYLQKLFQVIRKEQSQLLEHYQAQQVLETILEAEQDLHSGNLRLRNRQWTQAETAFHRALQSSYRFEEHTTLLDELLVRLLDGRSDARLHLEDLDGVLQDVKHQERLLHRLLATSTSTTTSAASTSRTNKLVREWRMAALTRQSDALKGLARFGEAQEALECVIRVMEQQAKLGVQSPTVGEKVANLHKKWNQLQLAKSKAVAITTRQGENRRLRSNGENDSTTLVVTVTAQSITTANTSEAAEDKDDGKESHDESGRQSETENDDEGRSHSSERTGETEEDECIDTTTTSTSASQPKAKPGTYVQCLYGTGTVQEVRKCGTTKIQLLSWSPGRQAPTAYLMPGYYTVLNGGVDVASE
ncbi:expressed unknown protein [Seminavis robusta]|uniref:Uncharacterized protein n=1 Tax=Seminavis robusta TaxID=568900 RepID=A0A9N8DH49_9STRA|nr:expressed unknown protein [Seminavis robusta]|eukprot:Sro140_g065430.1 n/a (600) ;mRNA; f:40830-42629